MEEPKTIHIDDNEVGSADDEVIKSNDAPIPGWLKINYIIWPLWGILWFYLYWNGTHGWLDRGYWQELQRAAQTTFPFHQQVDKN